jgi:hypothetical protein
VLCVEELDDLKRNNLIIQTIFCNTLRLQNEERKGRIS